MSESGSIDRPVGLTRGAARWGSDVIVDMLRDLGIEYISFVPGASFRGLHDSIVNHGGNERPQIILCNHEMISVAVARGYARVTGRPMAVALHDFVGLANAGAAIYDAWVDRVPVLLLGGNGPMDTGARRPWIDWIHSANGQSALFRDFTKWDDQPASVAAFPQSILRAFRTAVTEPAGPTYICFDVSHQEEALAEPPPLPESHRYGPPSPLAPDLDAVHKAAGWLVSANSPLAFAGATGRHPDAVKALVELAETLAMPVVDTALMWQSFPMPHDLDFLGLEDELFAQADVVLALEGEDLGGQFRDSKTSPRVISVSLEPLALRGFTADQMGPIPVDIPILAGPAATLPLFTKECRDLMTTDDRARIEDRRRRLRLRHQSLVEQRARLVRTGWDGPEITVARLVGEVWAAVSGEDFVFTAGNLRQLAPGICQVSGPEQNVAGLGGAVVGDHSGMALGAALALQGSGKLPVAIVGDGDLLMAPQVLWTAAHHRIPGLWIVCNNRSYGNDERHQEAVARRRERPLENRWIGLRMDAPAVDFSRLAASLGASGFGPITACSDLKPALTQALDVVRSGGVAVVDVWT